MVCYIPLECALLGYLFATEFILGTESTYTNSDRFQEERNKRVLLFVKYTRNSVN
jgi:hypothetical protein